MATASSCENNTFDVFISYHRSERDVAGRLYAKLVNGFELDVWSVDDSGDDYDELGSNNSLVFRGIEASRVFIGCLTRTFAESIKFKKQYEHAREHKKPMVILLLEKVSKSKLYQLIPAGPIKFVKCYKDATFGEQMAGKYFGKLLMSIKESSDVDKLAHYSYGLAKKNPLKEAFDINEHGIVAYDAGELDHALDCFRRASELNKSEKVYFKNTVVVLFKLGRFGEAIKVANMALELDEHYHSVKSIKASCLNKKAIHDDNLFQNYESAIRDFDEAIGLDANEKCFHANKAGTLNRLGLFDQAIEAANMALDIDPAYSTARSQKAIALNEIGIKYLMREAFEDAILYFSGAIKCNPNEKVFYTNKAMAIMKLGYPDDAFKYIEESLKIENHQNINSKIIAQTSHKILENR